MNNFIHHNCTEKHNNFKIDKKNHLAIIGGGILTTIIVGTYVVNKSNSNDLESNFIYNTLLWIGSGALGLMVSDLIAKCKSIDMSELMQYRIDQIEQWKTQQRRQNKRHIER